MHNISILFVIDDLPMASGGVLHKRKQNPLHFQLVTIHGRGYLLNSCLKVLENAGFSETNYANITNAPDGRLWRLVPNRKFYADQKGDIPASKEVLLIHRLR